MPVSISDIGQPTVRLLWACVHERACTINVTDAVLVRTGCGANSSKLAQQKSMCSRFASLDTGLSAFTVSASGCQLSARAWLLGPPSFEREYLLGPHNQSVWQSVRAVRINRIEPINWQILVISARSGCPTGVAASIGIQKTDCWPDGTHGS